MTAAPKALNEGSHSADYGRLTVKLRGRAEAPALGAEGAQFLSARGAKQEAHHGPLQRLLDRSRTLSPMAAQAREIARLPARAARKIDAPTQPQSRLFETIKIRKGIRDCCNN